MKFSLKLVAAVAAISLVAAGLTGCNPAVSGTVATLSSLAATPASVSLVVGGTQAVVIKGTYSDATTATITDAVWASDATTVATVSAGTITAVAVGTANITATKSGKSVSIAVTVSSASISSTKYLYSNASATADIASTQDGWSSGSTIAEVTTDATYPRAIQVSSGTGWGGASSCLAFTKLSAGQISEYTTIEFKVKTTSYTVIQVKVPALQKDYPLTGGTALSNGWVQMSIPLSDFTDNPLSATEFGILNATGAGSFLVTDIAFSGTGAVNTAGLVKAVADAKTLLATYTVGAANGNLAQADHTAFSTAITAAEAVSTSTPSAQSAVTAAMTALNAATTLVKSKVIVLAPSAAPAAPTLTGVISLYNSSKAYTDVTGINWNPGWGQLGTLTDYTAGTATLKYLNLKNYQGVDFDGNRQDITGKSTLHISYWSLDGTVLKLFPINASTEYAITTTFTADGKWHDLEISIDQAGFDLKTIRQLKFEGAGNYYMDNIYFH